MSYLQDLELEHQNIAVEYAMGSQMYNKAKFYINLMSIELLVIASSSTGVLNYFLHKFDQKCYRYAIGSQLYFKF